MNKNEVNLHFENISFLTGYENGEEEFKKQVKGKLNYNEVMIFVFPKNIGYISSSFAQGFFADIIKSIGLEKAEERIKILSRQKGMHKRVINKLMI